MDEQEDEARGLNGIDETTPFNQIFRLAKTVKRTIRLHLSECRKYDHYVNKFNKIKNGMAKAFRRTNRLGGDYDTFPSK